MPTHKTTYKKIVFLIGQILDFKDNTDKLKQILETDSIDWEAFVKVASEHLVLTTCYCRLDQKSLLHYLPGELVTYLKELTEINTNRNKALLEEVKYISEVLQHHGVPHVFIKGSAMLAASFYNSLGERMVGDIDILVVSDHAEKAFSLIKAEGYNIDIGFNYDNTNFRHLPRQVHPNKLAAIELHDSILNKDETSLLKEKEVLAQAVQVNDISVPSLYHMNMINILAYQINSRGFRFKQWHFKHLYDSLVLKLLDDDRVFRHKDKHFIDYLSKLIALFQIKAENKSGVILKNKSYERRLSHYQLFKLKSRVYMKFYGFVERLKLIFTNKSYRTNVFSNKKLTKSS